MPRDNAEVRYDTVVEALAHRPGVTSEDAGKKGFGSTGQLRVDDRIFAMLVRGVLVVKLPRARVDQLVAAREGNRFDPRHDGRLMKEWLALAATSKLDWLALAAEALTFVRSRK